MELVTSRLLLRKLSESDLAAVHGYASDPAVTLREHLLIRGQWRDRLTFGALA
jgi:RimJ/RimL family protein N-acetyltransferase